MSTTRSLARFVRRRKGTKTNENPKHIFPPCFSLILVCILQSCVTICEKMSELTERSKCVFQAKLAEQAERYDGASRFILLFFFLFRAYFYTHARDAEREHFGENGPDLSPFFVPIRSRLSLSFLSLSLARRDLSAPTMRALLSLSHSPFFSLVNLPFLAQR